MLDGVLGDAPRSIGQALALSLAEPGELLGGIMELEDYVARYLHQPLSELEDATYQELVARFRHVVDMVRRENGQPAAGEWDPGEAFG